MKMKQVIRKKSTIWDAQGQQTVYASINEAKRVSRKIQLEGLAIETGKGKPMIINKGLGRGTLRAIK